jgi:PBP1b-binding outer membrane lipoprotein LpoB
MKKFKTVLSLLSIVILASSCAQIEKATEKWKTPTTPATTNAATPAVKEEITSPAKTTSTVTKKTTKKKKKVPATTK